MDNILDTDTASVISLDSVKADSLHSFHDDSSFPSQQHPDTDVDDDVRSTVSTVAESIGYMQSVCGVEVTRGFLAEMDSFLGNHHHICQRVADRAQELSRVNNSQRVKKMSTLYSAHEQTASTSSSSPSHPVAALFQQQQQQQQQRGDSQIPNRELPPAQAELRNLRRRGIVSSLNSSFRSHLEGVFASAPTPATAATTRRQTPQQQQQLRPQGSAPAAPPLPPHLSGDNGNDNNTAVGEDESVRRPDEAFFDRLLPPPPALDNDPEMELHAVSTFQVASRLLTSQFRNRLENFLQNHMVQHSVPRSRVEFRAPAPRQPQPQQPQQQHSHRHPQQFSAPSSSSASRLQRDVGYLRAQVEEMQQMMRASLRTQNEMNRLLTQQLSAVLSGISPSGEEGAVQFCLPQSVPLGKNRPEGKCVVCCGQDADVVFFRCGHQCSCLSCAQSLKERNLACPVCRAPVEEFVRAFQV